MLEALETFHDGAAQASVQYVMVAAAQVSAGEAKVAHTNPYEHTSIVPYCVSYELSGDHLDGVHGNIGDCAL